MWTHRHFAGVKFDTVGVVFTPVILLCINSATAVVIAAGEQVQRSAVAKTYKNMQDMILLLLHKYTYIISLNKEENKQIA